MSEVKRKIVAVSGGIDPITHAHTRMVLDAAKIGDVVVILNSDDWLRRKKGYVFMTWDERAEILRAIRGVVEVVPVDDSDGTVCEALARIKPDVFANGGDRKQGTTPEVELCTELGIELAWGVGGNDKIQSSSSLVKNAVEAINALKGVK